MMKRLCVILAAAAVMAFASCKSTAPLCATSNPVGSKVGESTAAVILGIIPVPANLDHGIQRAAKNGNITQISTVDQKMVGFPCLAFPLLYSSVTTVVTGE